MSLGNNLFAEIRDCTSLEIYGSHEPRNLFYYGRQVIREIVLTDNKNPIGIAAAADKAEQSRNRFCLKLERRTTDHDIKVQKWNRDGDIGEQITFFQNIFNEAKKNINGFTPVTISVDRLMGDYPVVFIIGKEVGDVSQS